MDNTKNIKDFSTITSMSDESYILGVGDANVGNGVKIKLDSLNNNLISQNPNNMIGLDSEGKLFIDKHAGGSLFPLLTPIWSDHLINDMRYLRADTFSWQDGEVYSSVYDKLKEEYDNGFEETEGGITFRRTANSFKIADVSQEQAIMSKYNSGGIAWYYILDVPNKCFKLPRTKFGFKGLRSNVGNNIAESLPNITGDFSFTEIGGSYSANGAFTVSSEGTAPYAGGGGLANTARHGYFDASRVSSTYQNNAPVQERGTQMYLYFYVGEYEQTAIEQTAGLNAELFNSKVDLDASNLNADGKSYVSGLGMPSGRYINLTLGASGSTYTAPANGWFVFNATATTNGSWFNLASTSKGATVTTPYCTTGGGMSGSIPVIKSSEVVVFYGNITNSRFSFIYAEGEQ